MANKNKFSLALAVFLVFLNICAWQEVFALSSSQNLIIDFLDVGQGDAAFIKTSQGHQILIDGGPGSTVLSKLAERMPFWDKSIDLIILTHPESDHMAGIMEILQRYQVDYFLWTGIVRDTPEYKKFISILEQKKNPPDSSWMASINPQKGAEVITVSAGQVVRAGDAFINILYPFENLSGKELKNTSNDSCIVARLAFGQDSFLFAGDISSVAEKNFFSQKNILASNVLKVSHHGSKYSTSEDFLQSVNPKIAVISVGKDNSYGHPTQEVLNRLENFGIQIKRTDQDGDIEIMSDGENIIVK